MKKFEVFKEPNLLEAAIRKKSAVNFHYDSVEVSEELKNYAISKKAFVITHGCTGNVRDSEMIKSILTIIGYGFAAKEEDADLIIFNTCAIREGAEEKVFGELGRFKILKKNRKELLIGLCGCMAQEEKTIKRIKESYPFVDLIWGTHNLNQIPMLLEQAIKEKKVIAVPSIEGDIIELPDIYRESKYKALVNIMYGCDKFCTYCIVPYTRGKQRSRKKEDILQEVDSLIEKGYQEITLVGQNVNAYGDNLDDGSNFANLLELVAQKRIPRIRFITSHPWDFSDEMIEVIASYPNIMKQIHLPLQSGDDKILQSMGRRYSRAEYLALYDKLKSKIPGVAITTDIIVGFPNESEEAFLNTLHVVEHAKYDGAFTFIYSPRPGTPAAKVIDNVPLSEKKTRLQVLNEMVTKYSKMSNDAYLNLEVAVLIDGMSKKNKAVYSGYTETMKVVNFTSNKELQEGEIVKVKITNVKSWTLEGEYCG